MAEHRQGEGGLGDEQIAGHELEGRAGRVGAALIVAGDDDAAALPFDHHLRAAEHMAGGHEPHGDVADLERLAIGERLAAARGRRLPSRASMMASVSRVAST